MNAMTAIAAPRPEPGYRLGDRFTMNYPIRRWPWQTDKPEIVRRELTTFEITEILQSPFGPRCLYAPVGFWARLRWKLFLRV